MNSVSARMEDDGDGWIVETGLARSKLIRKSTKCTKTGHRNERKHLLED